MYDVHKLIRNVFTFERLKERSGRLDLQFEVASKTSDNTYKVSRLYGSNTWECSCPDFVYRRKSSCKHIAMIKEILE